MEGKEETPLGGKENAVLIMVICGELTGEAPVLPKLKTQISVSVFNNISYRGFRVARYILHCFSSLAGVERRGEYSRWVLPEKTARTAKQAHGTGVIKINELLMFTPNRKGRS